MIINEYVPGAARQRDTTGSLMAVLTAPDENSSKHAAHLGIMRGDMTEAEDRRVAAEWVAAMGTKLSYKQALAYFPHLEERDYIR